MNELVGYLTNLCSIFKLSTFIHDVSKAKIIPKGAIRVKESMLNYETCKLKKHQFYL